MGAKSAAAARIDALVAQSPVREALAWVARSQETLAEETIRIAEIPAPTFAEGARAEHVARQFAARGLRDIETAADGNVYALLPGADPLARPRLALFAHLDTVFGADVPVDVARRNGRLFAPGVGDNSAGVAGLLCALRALQEAGLRPVAPVWVVGTVGEEGLGDLCGARAATDRLASDCEVVVAVEGSFFGRVSHTAVGSRRWRVQVKAEGGHSWHDFGHASAVHALARAAAAITRIEVPSDPRTTFNIGEIGGGTGVNVIAERAQLVLDMRSVDEGALDRLAGSVKQILDGTRGDGIEVIVTEVGNRPAGRVAVTHPLVQTCAAILSFLGSQPLYAAASTDANVPLGRGIPAVTLGVTRGGGAHTRAEWIDIAPMVQGVQQLVLVLCALAGGRE
jgi:tripeptide aminopeptidase